MTARLALRDKHDLVLNCGRLLGYSFQPFPHEEGGSKAYHTPCCFLEGSRMSSSIRLGNSVGQDMVLSGSNSSAPKL